MQKFQLLFRIKGRMRKAQYFKSGTKSSIKSSEFLSYPFSFLLLFLACFTPPPWPSKAWNILTILKIIFFHSLIKSRDIVYGPLWDRQTDLRSFVLQFYTLQPGPSQGSTIQITSESLELMLMFTAEMFLQGSMAAQLMTYYLVPSLHFSPLLYKTKCKQSAFLPPSWHRSPVPRPGARSCEWVQRAADKRRTADRKCVDIFNNLSSASLIIYEVIY